MMFVVISSGLGQNFGWFAADSALGGSALWGSAPLPAARGSSEEMARSFQVSAKAEISLLPKSFTMVDMKSYKLTWEQLAGTGQDILASSLSLLSFLEMHKKKCMVFPETLSIYLCPRHSGQRSWRKKSQTQGAEWLLKLVWLLQPSLQFWIRNLLLAAPSQLGLTARNSGGGQIPRFQNSLSVYFQAQTHVNSRQAGSQFFLSSWPSLAEMSLPQCCPRLPSQALAEEISLPASSCTSPGLKSHFGKLCICLDVLLTSCSDSYTHPPLQSILSTSFPPPFLEAS